MLWISYKYIDILEIADDRTIVTKMADKGSCLVVWDRMDYLLETEKQLSDTNVYKSGKTFDRPS